MTTLPPSRPEASPLAQMVISTALLAGFLTWQMGWLWALGAVVGVFVHEYGHVLAINAVGCGPGRFRVVPFMGGAATPAIAPPTEFKDVLISLAGPSFGQLAVLPFYAAAGITQDTAWLGAAVAVILINLFNLIPAPPLDGSRALGPVLARIHPLVERGVLVVLGGGVVLWAIQTHNWIIALFVGISVLGALRRPALRPWALKLTGSEMIWAALLYLATVGLGLFALAYTFDRMGLSQNPLRLFHAFGLGQ